MKWSALHPPASPYYSVWTNILMLSSLSSWFKWDAKTQEGKSVPLGDYSIIIDDFLFLSGMFLSFIKLRNNTYIWTRHCVCSRHCTGTPWYNNGVFNNIKSPSHSTEIIYPPSFSSCFWCLSLSYFLPFCYCPWIYRYEQSYHNNSFFNS